MAELIKKKEDGDKRKLEIETEPEDQSHKKIKLTEDEMKIKSEDQSHKKDDGDENQQIVLDAEVFDYIDYHLITKELLEKCVKPSEEFYPGQANLIYLNWDMDEFEKLCPDYKYYCTNRKQQRIKFNSPPMKTYFGYSPSTNEKGQVQNNLKVDAGKYLDEEEGKIYLEKMAIVDEFFLNFIYWHQNAYPMKVKNKKKDDPPVSKTPIMGLTAGRKVDDNGMKFSKEVIESNFKGIIRPNSKEGYNDQISFNFFHPNPANRFIAAVNIYNLVDGKYKKIATCLTADDHAVDNPDSPLPKYSWNEYVYTIEKIFYSGVGHGVTPYLADIKRLSDQETGEENYGGSNILDENRPCPFKN